jgi:hypothetical protein
MIVQVYVSSHPRVLYPTGAGLGSFLHPWVESTPDPYRTGFGCEFHFSPTGALETWNLKKPERNLKPEKHKKPETQKKPDRNPKPPKRSSFTKPDSHPMGTWHLTGLGSEVRFHLWVRVQVSNSTRLYFSRARFFINMARTRPVVIPISCTLSCVPIGVSIHMDTIHCPLARTHESRVS